VYRWTPWCWKWRSAPENGSIEGMFNEQCQKEKDSGRGRKIECGG
jgi:hypothetical protein